MTASAQIFLNYIRENRGPVDYFYNKCTKDLILNICFGKESILPKQKLLLEVTKTINSIFSSLLYSSNSTNKNGYVNVGRLTLEQAKRRPE